MTKTCPNPSGRGGSNKLVRHSAEPPETDTLSGMSMALDLVQIRALAETKEDENARFRQFLKTRCNLEPDQIDQRVFETTAACGPESTALPVLTAAGR